MFEVVWGAPVESFVGAHIEGGFDFGERRTAAVMDGKKMIAGVIFHNWCPKSEVIEVSAAAIDPRWATRSVLRKLFEYGFSVAQVCVSRTHEDNKRVRRLWLAFGATEHILPRLRGREASEAVSILTDDAWKNSKFMR